MTLLVAALIVAGAVWWAAQGDPRAVLIWQPLALTAPKVAARCADITVKIQRVSVVSIRRSGTSQMIATRM